MTHIGSTPVLSPDDRHNRRLLDHVRPADWASPDPAGRYNLVVVGAGTAGLVSAAGAAGLGARVALVERRLLGGDCLNFGCVPSKGILAAARSAQAVRDAGRYGVAVAPEDQPEGGAVRADFGLVMERMRRLRAGIARHDAAARFRDLGVDVFFGEARFTGSDRVQVGDTSLRFRKAVIATGGRPGVPPIEGLEAAGYLTNETIFSLTDLPRRMVVLGGGAIGCELAQAFARLGTSVTLLQRNARLLPRDDPDASEIVARRFEAEGIRVHRHAAVSRVERDGPDKTVTFEVDGQSSSVACDAILVAVGRVPNLEGLGLDRAGVAYNEAGVTVDDRLRTTNRRIYAAGDICTRAKFTHAADAMARIVLRNALFGGRARVSALHIPHSTYTDPEVAQVGLTAAGAEAQGIPTTTFTVPFTDLDRAVLDGKTEGFARIHIHRKSGRILGATVVAAHAGELVAVPSVAMASRLRVGALSAAVLPYPTEAEVWRRLGDAWQRTRLKPWVHRLFARYFAWRR